MRSFLLHLAFAVAALAVLVLALPSAVAAQGLLTVPAGTRIRLDLIQPVPSGARAQQPQALVGTLTGASTDSVLLSLGTDTPSLRVPMSAVRAAWRSDGRASLMSTALGGSWKPALGGAVMGALRGSINRRDRDPSVLATAISDAALGAIAGAARAMWMRTDRWRSLPMPTASVCTPGMSPCAP